MPQADRAFTPDDAALPAGDALDRDSRLVRAIGALDGLCELLAEASMPVGPQNLGAILWLISDDLHRLARD